MRCSDNHLADLFILCFFLCVFFIISSLFQRLPSFLGAIFFRCACLLLCIKWVCIRNKILVDGCDLVSFLILPANCFFLSLFSLCLSMCRRLLPMCIKRCFARDSTIATANSVELIFFFSVHRWIVVFSLFLLSLIFMNILIMHELNRKKWDARQLKLCRYFIVLIFAFVLLLFVIILLDSPPISCVHNLSLPFICRSF